MGNATLYKSHCHTRVRGFPIFLMYQRCSQRCSTINQFSDMLFMILSSSALKGLLSHNLFNFASTSTFSVVSSPYKNLRAREELPRSKIWQDVHFLQSSPPYYNTIYNNIRVLPSVAGFEMKLSRHISHYLITYYLPSGEPSIIDCCNEDYNDGDDVEEDECSNGDDDETYLPHHILPALRWPFDHLTLLVIKMVMLMKVKIFTMIIIWQEHDQ